MYMNVWVVIVFLVGIVMYNRPTKQPMLTSIINNDSMNIKRMMEKAVTEFIWLN